MWGKQERRPIWQKRLDVSDCKNSFDNLYKNFADLIEVPTGTIKLGSFEREFEYFGEDVNSKFLEFKLKKDPILTIFY